MSCKLLSQDICDAGRSSVELLSTSLSTGTILLVPVTLLSPLSSFQFYPQITSKLKSFSYSLSTVKRNTVERCQSLYDASYEMKVVWKIIDFVLLPYDSQ